MMVKLTPKRKQIMEVINSSDLPISAQQIHKCMPEGSLNLATIYRTLVFLETNHLIEAFSLFSGSKGTVRYYFRVQNPHLHFLFCQECQLFTPYHDCSFQKNRTSIEEKYQYQIHSHVLYFSGVCRDCIQSA
jgi:Fur family transcriptional regulator, ferric uptake regulator